MGIAAERFAYLLRQMLAEGHTQQWIADRIGVHQTHVGRLARGARTPGLDVVERTLGLVGVAGDYLFAEGPVELDYRHYQTENSPSRAAFADFQRTDEWSFLTADQREFLRNLEFPSSTEPTMETYRAIAQGLRACAPADDEAEEQTGMRVKRRDLEKAIPALKRNVGS